MFALTQAATPPLRGGASRVGYRLPDTRPSNVPHLEYGEVWVFAHAGGFAAAPRGRAMRRGPLFAA